MTVLDESRALARYINLILSAWLGYSYVEGIHRLPDMVGIWWSSTLDDIVSQELTLPYVHSSQWLQYCDVIQPLVRYSPLLPVYTACSSIFAETDLLFRYIYQRAR